MEEPKIDTNYNLKKKKKKTEKIPPSEELVFEGGAYSHQFVTVYTDVLLYC